MKLYIATANAHKVEELRTLLAEALPNLQVLSGDKLGGMPHVDETATTFEGNALLKAEALHALAPEGSWTLADDSGLAIDALNGAPGIFSARHAGPDATDADNRRKILAELEGVPEQRRRARFICALVLLGPSAQQHTFTGTCEGNITLEEQGSGGFGYDPLFKPTGYGETFGVLPSETKHALSHRGRAITELASFLANIA